jgi:hypothetical protein
VHLLKIQPEAIDVSCRVLFEHLQRKDHIVGSQGLTIRPFDARAQVESHGLRVAGESITLGQPGCDTAIHAVKEQKSLVNHALGAINGASSIRAETIGKIAFGAGDNSQYTALGSRGR